MTNGSDPAAEASKIAAAAAARWRTRHIECNVLRPVEGKPRWDTPAAALEAARRLTSAELLVPVPPGMVPTASFLESAVAYFYDAYGRGPKLARPPPGPGSRSRLPAPAAASWPLPAAAPPRPASGGEAVALCPPSGGTVRTSRSFSAARCRRWARPRPPSWVSAPSGRPSVAIAPP